MALDVDHGRSLYKKTIILLLVEKLIFLLLCFLGLGIIYVLLRVLAPFSMILFLIALIYGVFLYGLSAEKLYKMYKQHINRRIYSFVKALDANEISNYNGSLYASKYRSFDSHYREYEESIKDRLNKDLEEAKQGLMKEDPDGLYQKAYLKVVKIAIKLGIIEKYKDYDEYCGYIKLKIN